MDINSKRAISRLLNEECNLKSLTVEDVLKTHDTIGVLLSISGNLTALDYCISKGLNKFHISLPILTAYGHLDTIRFLHTLLSLSIDDYCGNPYLCSARSVFDLATLYSRWSILEWMEENLNVDNNKYVAETIYKAIRNNSNKPYNDRCMESLKRMYSRAIIRTTNKMVSQWNANGWTVGTSMKASV